MPPAARQLRVASAEAVRRPIYRRGLRLLEAHVLARVLAVLMPSSRRANALLLLCLCRLTRVMPQYERRGQRAGVAARLDAIHTR
jgi:hypothetical protein